MIKYRSRVDPVTGCWEWQASKSHGYGNVLYDGRVRSAHRLSYEAFIGPIPEGLVLDHFACTNPGCVNPEHVRPVSHRENSLRSDTSVGALNTAKTHCDHGHPLSGSNLVITGRYRNCRACAKRIATVINRRNGFEPHVPVTHCKRGHPYSGANLYVHNGRRSCKQCRNLATQRYRLARATRGVGMSKLEEASDVQS